MPAIVSSTVYHYFRAILPHQEDANAEWMGPINIALAFDDGLVAVGKHLRNQIKAVGIAWIGILVLPNDRHIGLRIIRDGGHDVHADSLIGREQRIVALERGIQQIFEITRDALMPTVWRGHHHRNALDQFPMFLVRS